MAQTFLDTAIPIVLILIVVGFIWSKFGKHLARLFEWIKDMFRSKRHRAENPKTYEYVEYD